MLRLIASAAALSLSVSGTADVATVSTQTLNAATSVQPAATGKPGLVSAKGGDVTPVGVIGSVTRQETVMKLESGSELVALYSEPAYVNPIYVMSLHGTSFQQGMDAGVLFGAQFAENYASLFHSLLGDFPKLEDSLTEVIELFLDWQWASYLSVEVPQEYMDELEGLAAGGLVIGIDNLSLMVSRGITLANLPGDVEDILFVLIDEFAESKSNGLNKKQRLTMPALKKVFHQYQGHQCSMFGAWGDRTQDGNLYAMRNLDWLTDLGINKYKLLTVHHPASGNAHVTVGFAAIWGAMAGMSAKGLTVHEANLESKLDTFKGFPWILRLRHVMAYANNLEEAMTILNETNNTVGFNFMVGSASDNKATCLETMAGYTAAFGSMDEREVGAVDPYTGEVYGFPLSNAVYRTNHGYDPVTQENYQWYGYHAYEDSKRRYNDMYKMFSAYEAEGVKVGVQEAVTITATVGEKGDGTDEAVCDPALYAKGLNILSVTYDPNALTLYTAFEDGEGADWVPAACNGYIKVDMTQWF
jgi:hypothetical protein